MNSKTFQTHVDHVLNGDRPCAIMHGDCLKHGFVLPAESVDLVLVDPPYGMKYRGLEDRQKPILNDERPFVWWLHHAYRVGKDPSAIACFTQWRYQQDFRRFIEVAGYAIRSHVIWDRMRHGMGAPHCTFAPMHDVIWFATKGRYRFPGGRPNSILHAANVPVSQRFHTTQKPDELMRDLVRSLTPAGGVVCDFTMGSGSTGVAAIELGCRFIGFEQDDENFAIAKRRLDDAVARREQSGRVKGCAVRPMHYSEVRRAVA